MTPARPAREARIRRNRLPIDGPGVIRGRVYRLQLAAPQLDIALVIAPSAVACSTDFRSLRALAHLLDCLHHILRLVVVGIANRVVQRAFRSISAKPGDPRLTPSRWDPISELRLRLQSAPQVHNPALAAIDPHRPPVPGRSTHQDLGHRRVRIQCDRRYQLFQLSSTERLHLILCIALLVVWLSVRWIRWLRILLWVGLLRNVCCGTLWVRLLSILLWVSRLRILRLRVSGLYPYACGSRIRRVLAIVRTVLLGKEFCLPQR